MVAGHAGAAAEQYLETGARCATAYEPKECMESYGFECHQGRMPHRSTEAQTLGCNLDLGDGRKHFVQMLYDDGGWNVETEHTYRPEYADDTTAKQGLEFALVSYLRDAMKGYSTHSSGAGTDESNLPAHFETGERRADGRINVRAACGRAVDLPLRENVSESFKSYCRDKLWRTVKKLSQTEAEGSYRVAAPSEFEWQSRTVALVSGDTAVVWVGDYSFTGSHVPCLWISDCCSIDGQLYLDSCRTPTEGELTIIDRCLGTKRGHRSDEFHRCLREEGMTVGCEEQPDGSQVCY